jgi:tellurite resistance protein TehA-like permease
MIRLWLLRAVLVALPFVAWYVWTRFVPPERVRPPPWPWLLLAGIGLVGASTVATVLIREDNREQVYIPGEVQPDGSISEGRFEDR